MLALLWKVLKKTMFGDLNKPIYKFKITTYQKMTRVKDLWQVLIAAYDRQVMITKMRNGGKKGKILV